MMEGLPTPPPPGLEDVSATRFAAAPAEPIPAKILVADDDPRNLTVVAEILSAPGVELVLVESGEEVLRRVLVEDYAAILLDVRMPRLDGYEVAALIRNRPRSSRIPILFLTAYDKDDRHVFRGYSAGAVDYVFKPIEPLILKSKVDVFVDLYRKTEEIRRAAEEERRLLVENLRVRVAKLAAEQALRRQDEHQSLVLRALPIALYTAAAQEDHHRLQFTNEGAEHVTGYPAEAFRASPGFFAERLHPDDRERVMAQLAALDEAGATTLEYRWRHADGGERHILDQAVMIYDEAGRPREIFGLWLDVTERKQLETSLLHASKLEAVGRLTGGIAHDFNNMLSVVIGNLDLLQSTLNKDDERAARRVRLAIEGAQRCADLTSRLLSFSRRQPVQTSVVDAGRLVSGMLEMLQRTLGERIAVELHVDDGLWPVEIDGSQLETALLNLAVNARDAMPDGGRLTVSLRNEMRDGKADGPGCARVVVSVTDTGTGMTPEVRERVFEPFFTTKEAGRGTGLGLSMVYGFVSQSQGAIEIETAPGEGTTIRLVLPAATGTAVDTDGEPDAGWPVLDGAGRTILVVEDDATVRQVTVQTLQSFGFAVREAASGDDAMAQLQHDPGVSLVLSDISMPGTLTGTDLARRVGEVWPDVRVLLTTGHSEEASGLGAFNILYKPYRLNDLARRIGTALGDG